jgi:hypothetical protein
MKKKLLLIIPIILLIHCKKESPDYREKVIGSYSGLFKADVWVHTSVTGTTCSYYDTIKFNIDNIDNKTIDFYDISSTVNCEYYHGSFFKNPTKVKVDNSYIITGQDIYNSHFSNDSVFLDCYLILWNGDERISYSFYGKKLK